LKNVLKVMLGIALVLGLGFVSSDVNQHEYSSDPNDPGSGK